MKREEIDSQQQQRILECCMHAILNNGLKATTMDSIAASLQMSKRTLYEIFGTKDNMFVEVMEFFHKRMKQRLTEIFQNSSNIMESIVKSFIFNRDIMSRLSVEFIRDMQEFTFNEHNNSDYRRQQSYQHLYEILQKGVEEGYFIKDLNLKVQCRILNIQMQALKRTEELFPEDITLIEIYDSIILGFLRGISTPKGLEELERYLPSIFPDSNNLENKK